MGQQGSRESGYGQHQPMHPLHGPSNGMMYYGDPSQQQPNVLPIPPKEPPPPGPMPFPNHFYRDPNFQYHQQGSSSDEGRGSGSRRKGLFRALGFGGNGRKDESEGNEYVNGRRAHRRSERAEVTWRYPDGTPFPKHNAELAPERPAFAQKTQRSNSFSGQTPASRKKWARLLGDDIDLPMDRRREKERRRVHPEDHPPAGWGGWRQRLPESFRNPLGHGEDHRWQDDERARIERRESYGRSGKYRYRRASLDNGYSGGQRQLQPFMDHPARKGVSLEGYVPPHRQPTRKWTYPDGTPMNAPGEMAHNGHMPPAAEAAAEIRDDEPGTPVNEPVYPEGSIMPMPMPGGPSRFAGSMNGTPHPMMNTLPQPPQPQTATPRATSMRGIDEVSNTSVSFSFDRRHDFSHYSYHTIKFAGKYFPTAYHLWEAMKYIDTEPGLVRKIRKCERVKEVQRLVREVGNDGVRADWSDVMLRKMDEALHLKFSQHPSIRDGLLRTENKRLVFLSHREPFWGWSKDTYSGNNHLGLCLERVRDRLLREVGFPDELISARNPLPRGPGVSEEGFPAMPMPMR